MRFCATVLCVLHTGTSLWPSFGDRYVQTGFCQGEKQGKEVRKWGLTCHVVKSPGCGSGCRLSFFDFSWKVGYPVNQILSCNLNDFSSPCTERYIFVLFGEFTIAFLNVLRNCSVSAIKFSSLLVSTQARASL